MNSTLAPVQQPVPHDGDRTVAPNQLVDIWCGTDFNNSYYTMQNHLDPKSTAEALSSVGAPSDIVNEFTTLASQTLPEGGPGGEGEAFPTIQIPETFFEFAWDDDLLGDTSPRSPITSLSPKSTVSADGSSQTASTKSPQSPPRRKRGRPRKVRKGAAATAAPKGELTDAEPTARPHAASSADVMHFDDPKTMRVRRKNRIAADKCRSRRRLEEDALKSKHECLEKEYRGLSHAAVDLVAEIQVLKNMLLEHGNCDCHLIQDYLKEAASAWVTKKTRLSSTPSTR